MAEYQDSSLRSEDMYSTREEQLKPIKSNSRSIEGSITRYILNTKTIIDGERLRRVTFGENNSKPHKTILLVGETGAGKSTLINAMINYVLGVKSEDKFWCEIIETKENQTNSQTKAVTVYDVFTEHCPISLTIIDTPGFGSTEGVMEDNRVTESLHELFRSKDGVHEINAVCLVVTSLTVRLTERQLYVFNAVLSLFGKDVKDNIVVFITHATRKPRNTINAIKISKIPCAQTDDGEPVYFRLDSFHCEDMNDEEIVNVYQESWDMLTEAMKSFLSFLNHNKAVSLAITEAVLRNRKRLTAAIFNLKDRIRLAELKQKELQKTKEDLQKHERENGDLANFQCEVDEPYKEKVPIEYQWWHFRSKEATCCGVCKENCHYPGCWWVKDLSRCSVMSDGKCTVCTEKCKYTDHAKDGKIYVMKTRKVKKTSEDLKKKYEMKSGEIKSMIILLEEEVAEEEKVKRRLVDECYECVTMLEEIALNSDSVYTLLHLDFLIEKLKETRNTDKVKKLKEMKKRADDKQLAQTTRWFTALHY